MKKLLLFLACVALFQYAGAIELTFWLGNQKITPGETVKFNDIKVETYDDYKEVTMKPALYLSSSIYSSDIKVTATCTSGQSIQVCIAGKCRGGETVTLDGFTVQSNQKTDLGFDYIDEFDLDEPIPTVVTRIEAEDVTESGSNVSFIIEMSEDGASVTEISASDFVKAVDGGIMFNAENQEFLYITNILGINMFADNVSGDGFVALPQGLYIYKLGGKSGKIYVR